MAASPDASRSRRDSSGKRIAVRRCVQQTHHRDRYARSSLLDPQVERVQRTLGDVLGDIFDVLRQAQGSQAMHVANGSVMPRQLLLDATFWFALWWLWLSLSLSQLKASTGPSAAVA